MPDRDDIIADRAKRNMAELIELGPGLRHSTVVWVVAKDSAAGKVLLGGLGALGVGRMWTDTHESHREDETYADAPETSWRNSVALGGGRDGI